MTPKEVPPKEVPAFWRREVRWSPNSQAGGSSRRGSIAADEQM